MDAPRKTTQLMLSDHQSGAMPRVHDYSPAEFRNTVIGRAPVNENVVFREN